jgi:hypothetical protein
VEATSFQDFVILRSGVMNVINKANRLASVSVNVVAHFPISYFPDVEVDPS